MLTFNDYAELAERERAHRRAYRNPGIYCFELNGEVVYVGKSKCLHSRFKSHAEQFAKVRLPKQEQYKKYELLKPYLDQLEWKVLEETQNIDDAEKYWISYYEPIFNINVGGKQQHFKGTEWDIEAFVNGVIDYKELKEMCK